MAIQRLTEFLAEREDREPCLVEPSLLPYGGKMFLYGQAGVMKSMVMLQLSYEVATGRPWLDRFPTTKGTVIYLQCELPRGKFRDRVRIMNEAYPELEPDQLWVLSSKTLRVTPTDKEFQGFVKEVRDIKPDLWIIDPQYKVLVGDENSATDVQRLYDQLDTLSEETGCATVIVSHSRNTRFDSDGGRLDMGYQEIAGSHRQQDWGDAVCRLQRTKRGKVLKFEKMRYDEMPEAVELVFDERTLRHSAEDIDRLGAQVKAMLMSGAADMAELTATLVASGTPEITVRRKLEQLEHDGTLVKEAVASDRRKKVLRLKGA